jgi:peptidoglycan hydrolase-like protein with peptidoglycan-binding domain
MSYDNKKTLTENVEEILLEQGLGSPIPSNFGQNIISQVRPQNRNVIRNQQNIDTIYNELKKAAGGAGTNERDLQNAIDKLTSITDYNALNTKISQNPIYGSNNLQEILNGELGISDARTAAYIKRKLQTIGIDMTYGANNTDVFTNSIKLNTTGQSSGSSRGTGTRRSKYIPVGKNDCVIRIQTFLKGQGFSLGPKDIDGVYGPYTIRAVQEYQRKNNLTPDGIWGPATAAKTENQILPCGVSQTNTNQTTTSGTEPQTTNPPSTVTNNDGGTTKIDSRNVYDRVSTPQFRTQENPKLDLSSPSQTTTQNGMEMYNQLNKQGLIGPVRFTNGKRIKYRGEEPLPPEVSKYLSDQGYIQRRDNEWIKR